MTTPTSSEEIAARVLSAGTVRRHAYIKGYESAVDDVRSILAAAPDVGRAP